MHASKDTTVNLGWGGGGIQLNELYWDSGVLLQSVQHSHLQVFVKLKTL